MGRPVTEREALLHAVVKDPRDRTPLLVYADWLLENGVPAAEATAEFIHLACAGKSLRWSTSPVACLDWLRGNWVRLLPTLAARAAPTPWSQPNGPGGPKFLADDARLGDVVEMPFGYGAAVTNATIDALVGVAGNTSRREKVYPCRLKLKVGFGLLLAAEMKSAWGKKQVWPLLAQDQPQLTMEFHRSEQFRRDAVNSLEAPKDDGLFAAVPDAPQ